MTKEKNYKNIAKSAFKDKVNNILFILKFLDAKGGLELIREYFTDAIPAYILEHEGFGGAKKWMLRQLLRTTPHGYMQKILDQVIQDGAFLNQNFKIIENTKEQITSEIDCKYMRALVKQGRKYDCNFDIREYYCQNACIPLLKKLLADVYLNLKVELIKNGCVQTLKIDTTSFKKDETAYDEQRLGGL